MNTYNIFKREQSEMEVNDPSDKHGHYEGLEVIQAHYEPKTLPMKYIDFDNREMTQAHSTIRALKHPLRQRILVLINDHRQITVTEIYVKLRMDQSVVSQHLAILRRAGVLKTERDGKFMFYSINHPVLDRIKESISNFSHA